MAMPITVPRLGWHMEEGVFLGWLKPDGMAVRAGQALFSLESDKATEEIECLDDGILRIPPDGPREGERVAVGKVIGYVVKTGERAPFEDEAPPTPPRASPSMRRLARAQGVNLQAVTGTGPAGRITTEDVRRLHTDAGTPGAPAAQAAPPEQPTISPRARRVARELGIDWMRLHGSGRTGRIRERDVRAAVAGDAQSSTIAVSSVRRTIAERMLNSHRSTAPVTLNTTADATNLVNLRNQFKAAQASGHGLVPSYTDFLVKLSAVALHEHPMLRARLDNDRLVLPEGMHIGIAVDTEVGLLVPVLRDVATQSLQQLAARSRDLIERARQRTLKAEDMHDGCFTITNLGAFGVDSFTPLIHCPQCAILGVGRIQRRPVALGEQVALRDQITLSLTFDHRIVDGAPAARFLQRLSAVIENPGPWLMS